MAVACIYLLQACLIIYVTMGKHSSTNIAYNHMSYNNGSSRPHSYYKAPPHYQNTWSHTCANYSVKMTDRNRFITIRLNVGKL